MQSGVHRNHLKKKKTTSSIRDDKDTLESLFLIF